MASYSLLDWFLVGAALLCVWYILRLGFLMTCFVIGLEPGIRINVSLMASVTEIREKPE
jgi:hypothetical protein